jgi:hypothetical protein
MDAELEGPRGRFNVRPAVAIAFSEEVWNRGDSPSAEEALRQGGLDWLLEEDAALGPAQAVDGSAGRGAEGWIAVVEWLGDAVSHGVVDVAIGYGFARVVDRLRGRREAQPEDRTGGFEVSRGGAAVLAGVHAAETFGEGGPLEIEAVEEPSSIAGYEITELSYVGVEPWIVLLRNREARDRFFVVVMPDGTVEGALRVPFLPSEELFMRPSRFHGEGDR